MGVKQFFDNHRPLILNSQRFPKKLCILVLAPHPDDFDEICITLRFFKENGNSIYVAVVSSGASGVEDTFCSPPTKKNKAEIREKEQQASCAFFGLPASHLTFLHLKEDPMGHPMDTDKNYQQVKRHFLRIHPDMVFLPHGNDTNLGHQWTYSIFSKIASQAGYPITAFLNKDPKTIQMRTDLYNPFDERAAQWKAHLLRFHQSQHQRNWNTRNIGFDERILRVNRKIAEECGEVVEYAEAFELEFWGE
ncbi:MAG: PIG-L deacetylase family protein [bacterium]